MIITIIAQMPSKQYYCGTCHDIDLFIKEAKNKYKAGYFYQDKNKGQVKIVFSCPGDFHKQIKRFGCKDFMTMIKAYTPLNDAIIQLLT